MIWWLTGIFGYLMAGAGVGYVSKEMTDTRDESWQRKSITTTFIVVLWPLWLLMLLGLFVFFKFFKW